MRRSNTEIILRALLDSRRIDVDGRLYCLDDQYRLCQVAWDQDGEEALMIVNMGDGIALSDFIRWCDDIAEDTIAIIGLNHALTHLR